MQRVKIKQQTGNDDGDGAAESKQNFVRCEQNRIQIQIVTPTEMNFIMSNRITLHESVVQQTFNFNLEEEKLLLGSY